jgi:L-2-hydroxyglutarate oxidase LhgO
LAPVFGLAIGRELAVRGREVLILERAAHFGSETSSRNSEVIHAGIYYPESSLKALFCVEGRHQLYEYCQTHHIPHRNSGKLIVATTEEEIPILDTLAAKAAANNVSDLQYLSKAEAKKLEPALHCSSALLSPSTGIIDSHQLMLSYVGEIEDNGGNIAYHAPFNRAEVITGGYEVHCPEISLTCRNLINSAGLYAQEVAHRIEGLSSKCIPMRYITKGSYFTMNARSPFSRLIYPVPNTASLGIHVTLDIAGQIRFGPDQEWVESINYEVDPNRAENFYEAIRKYWPELPDNSLLPAYSGIRPKTQSPNDSMMDFIIDNESTHSLPGLVNLFGMESPGLTSSLAIGSYVTDVLSRTDRL